MLEHPRIGAQCWIITDIWETLCPVPVVIVKKGRARGSFVCRWKITEEYHEDYEAIWPELMFATEQEACEQIKEDRRMQECREKKARKPFI